MSARSVLVCASLVALCVCATGCKACDGGPSGSAESACRRACEAVVEACGTPASVSSDLPACLSACVGESKRFELADCSKRYQRYLDCVSEAKPSCAKAPASAATLLDQGRAASACADTHAAYRACVAPCVTEGTMHTAERGDAELEYVSAGCKPCGELAGGVRAGGSCQVAKVCAQVCCACPGTAVRYRARVCDRGACAREAEACKSVCARARRDR